jgi:hypothetical protein
MGLAIVGLASTGALVTVVSVNNVDTLSTVALALAVLAFSAQLIVSLAQAQGSASQLSQTERINSETQVALAEIRSTSGALLTNQTELLDKLLAALLPSATVAALQEVAGDAGVSMDANGNESGQFDYEEVASRVEENVRRSLHEFVPSVSRSVGRQANGFPSWVDAPLDDSSTEKAVAILRRLEANELALFLRTVTRRLINGPTQTPNFGWVVYGINNQQLHEGHRALVEKGLLEMKSPLRLQNENARPHAAIKMTEDGARIVRLIFGKTPVKVLYPANFAGSNGNSQ